MFKKLCRLLRLSHWSKGLFVLLGVLYANAWAYWGVALLAALAFCLLASAVYIYNDVQDLEEDKAHPRKSQRPLANNDISIPFALGVLVFLLIMSLVLGLMISPTLALILIGYLVINLIYNHWLRRALFFDVLCIASGFMLRILAGTIGIGLPITWWLTIAATLLSLFIALCKRRLEMRLWLLETRRMVIRKYNVRVLDFLMVGTACGCFITYLLYIVYVREESLYFVLTLPFCGIGLWRFIYLTTREGEQDDPVALFFCDNPSRLNLLCFFLLTLMAVMQ